MNTNRTVSAMDEARDLADSLRDACTPFSVAELEAAIAPLPHLYTDGVHGLFPIGRVTILASPSRAGKTTCELGVAAHFALGLKIGSMQPYGNGPVVVYSAEDDREDFARIVRAALIHLGAADFERARPRIVVPDLFAEGMAELRSLVKLLDRTPCPNLATVNAIINGIGPLHPALVMFETVSRLSEAEEDNPGLRTLIATAEEIARRLNCAVSISHHTSQLGAGTMKDLSFDTSAIRGMTALVSNSRQNAILLNLGSEAEPLPATDARRVLRGMVLPGNERRLSAWVTLDSSKSLAPPPIFFEWSDPDPVPAATIIGCAPQYRGWSWPKLREAVMARKADVHQAKSSAAFDAGVAACVEIVGKLEGEKRPPTVSAVSFAAHHNPTWGKSYLSAAVQTGALTERREPVPHAKGLVSVFHTPDFSMAAKP